LSSRNPLNKMNIVGLTGGIGSGKTLIAKIFMHLGIPVFNADMESRSILDNDIDVRYWLTKWFGQGIFVKGLPDRSAISNIVFKNPDELLKLNNLLHPKVMQRFSQWTFEHKQKNYLIHEAAILFESGLYSHMDSTILVTAPESLRLQRVCTRDNVSEESVRHRMQNQWTDEKKTNLATYIINNDEKTPLIPRIIEIHTKLIR
jgi:dephospho-CoA kinase